jgi:LmbE family N-acetylglucosaminyl deacetylase
MKLPCLLLLATPFVSSAQSRPVMAVFAHPDDERVVAPLLHRVAHAGREVHLVIATDGAKGVRPHSGFSAGAALASARSLEARCAADRIGVKSGALHLLGLEDAGLANFTALGKLRTALTAIIDSVRPSVIVTFGPEGGTGHPDHRLVGDVMTEIVQHGDAHDATLLFAQLPADRIRTAPRASPGINGVADSLLTVRVPVEDSDITAGREEFACHRTQYTPEEMARLNAYLAHVWNEMIWLRPWNGQRVDRHSIFPEIP